MASDSSFSKNSPQKFSWKEFSLKQTPPEEFPFLLHCLMDGLGANSVHLHVVSCEKKARQVFSILQGLSPIKGVVFPSWDCQPYDGISPSLEVMALRREALQWMKGRNGPFYVITTPGALFQMIPPSLLGEEKTYTKGSAFQRQEFIDQCIAWGYERQGDMVRSTGQMCVRGSLVDLFPSHQPHPSRLDFFGDVLSDIRFFDPQSQRSFPFSDHGVSANHLHLRPLRDVVLDPEQKTRFQSQYNKLLQECSQGSQGLKSHRPKEDKLLRCVNNGVFCQGIEHWTGLFYQTLRPLWDFCTFTSLSVEEKALQSLENYPLLIESSYKKSLQRYQKTQDIPQSYGGGGGGFQEQDFHEKGFPVGFLQRPAPPHFETLYVKNACLYRWIESMAPTLMMEKKTPSTHTPWQRIETYVSDTFCPLSRPLLLNGVTTTGVENLRRLCEEKKWPFLPLAYPDLHKLLPGTLGLICLPLDKGFEGKALSIITAKELGVPEKTPSFLPRVKTCPQILERPPFEEGDFVIHRHYGLGCYQGLETLHVEELPHRCASLAYDGGDKLFVPIENIDLLTKYTGQGVLDKLGSQQWLARQEKVKKRLYETAKELMHLAGKRARQQGPCFFVHQESYEKFCQGFEYIETPDQEKAIDDTLKDLASGGLMDRLVCGDAGFGKTEVALRAAYVVAQEKSQVVLMAPTTLLVRQHALLFQKRFAHTPFKVAHLSRFTSTQDVKKIKKELEDGTLSVLIATHGLLSKGFSFKKLGLVILDEEHHFGVLQKEKLRHLQDNAHTLTLTATPIPRTFQMALCGVYSLSLLTTPPSQRYPVKTTVGPFEALLIESAISQEINREGQVFYVCPRIEDLDFLHTYLRQTFPSLTLLKAHGKMPKEAIEKTITSFDEGKGHVLLSTHIVESGIDIPRANTIIVHRAHHFGLAQLYQLKGRVGRGTQQGYAYFTSPPHYVPSDLSIKRLRIVESLELGHGLSLATHDMEMRGTGNLVGKEQSGHIKDVGIELYRMMLEEAIEVLSSPLSSPQQEPKGPLADKVVGAKKTWAPRICLPIPMIIPESYVASSHHLALYRRLSIMEDVAEVENFREECLDRFGPFSEEMNNLLHGIRLKVLCKKALVSQLHVAPKTIVITFHDSFVATPSLVGWLHSHSSIRLRPDHSLVWHKECRFSLEDFLALEQFLMHISSHSGFMNVEGLSHAKK